MVGKLAFVVIAVDFRIFVTKLSHLLLEDKEIG